MKRLHLVLGSRAFCDLEGKGINEAYPPAADPAGTVKSAHGTRFFFLFIFHQHVYEFKMLNKYNDSEFQKPD